MFSPKDEEKFWLGDLDVYIDSETLPAFYARAEKPVGFLANYAEFKEGIPKVLVRKDLIEFGLTISMVIMEWTIDILEFARGGLKATSGNYSYMHYGSSYTDPPTHRYRFASSLIDDKIIEFVMHKGKVTEMGEIPTGGDDYNEVPVTLEALVDTTVSDERKNLGYFRIED